MSDVNPKNVLVRSPEWQTVRKSLLGQWMKRPEWCCDQLRRYLGWKGGKRPLANVNKNKLDVVMNYLTGTGFRTGRIKHSCITEIRTAISVERKIRRFKKD